MFVFTAVICGHYHEFSDCFEYLRKLPLKSSHPNTCQIFQPEKFQNQKFHTQKNPSIITVT